MKKYIFICARVQRKKTSVHILQRENWNKTNALVNVPKKETRHGSEDLNRINSREFMSFCLASDHKEKRPSRMPVNLKKSEFPPADVQAGSSSRTFHPEVTGAGGKVQSKKLYRLKPKLLHLHYVQTIRLQITHTHTHTPFWFIQRTFSILAAMEVRLLPR